MSVATSIPFCPMTPSGNQAEAGLQSFTLGQDLAQDPSATTVASSFGTLLDKDAGIAQGFAKTVDQQAALLIPSGIPLTAGCVAQVAAQQVPVLAMNPVQTAENPVPTTQLPSTVPGTPMATGATTPAPTTTLPTATTTGKPLSKGGAAPATVLRNGNGLVVTPLLVSSAAGQGTAVENTRSVGAGPQASQEESADIADDSTGTDSQDSQDSDAAPKSLPIAVAAELIQLSPQPLNAPVQVPSSVETQVSTPTAAAIPTTKESAPAATQSQTWTSLRQEPQSTEKTTQTSKPEPQRQPAVRVETTLAEQATVTGANLTPSYPQPTIRSAKALVAYEAGLQNSAPQSAVPTAPAPSVASLPTATPQAAAVQTPALKPEAPTLPAEAATTPVTQSVADKAVSLSLESSASTLANAKDGTAKEGAASGSRGGDSMVSFGGANSAATPSASNQGNAAPLQKKAQLTDVQADEKSAAIDGTRNAKSEANMSINRRTRTEATRSEDTLATATSSVPVTRTETVQVAQKTSPSESAQRTVAAVTELVDRLQARPATKVAIDVPLSGEQNVSVKLEYKAGVLHVNFRTDSTELRDALSREWSTVAAQGDSALRFAEPSFNSNSQNHGQQQSKADAFDLSWNRQGQPQQQRNQQQEEASRAFSLPGSRSSGNSASSATDGVSNRDRTTASRQVAPETTRHLNVVA